MPTFRSLTVRPLLAGLPPEGAVALGALWWAVFLLTGHAIGCVVGGALTWLVLALVLRRDPHAIDVVKRALQLRSHLEA